MPDQNLPNTPPLSFPDVADVPSMPPAAPETAPENLDIPPMIAEPKIPKKKSGRIIATILGILLLVGAVGAGVVLVGQKQLFEQKAKECMDPCQSDRECANGEYCYVPAPPACSECKTRPTSCTPHCAGNIPYTCDSNGISLEGIACTGTQTCKNGVCTGDTTPTTCTNGTSREADCTQTLDGQTCPGSELWICKNGTWGEGLCLDIADNCPTTQQDCSPVCVTDHPDGDPYCNAGGYWCQNYIGDWAKPKSCFAIGSCSAPYSYSSGNYCVNTSDNCDPGPGCSSAPDPRCTGGTPTTPPGATPTPTPTPPAAACTVVKAYDTNWNQLTAAQLSALTAGSVVRFTISGTPAGQIDKARFTINGVLGSEVTTKKPGTDEYYTEYTIPAGIYSFTVTAQIHHLTLGWF